MCFKISHTPYCENCVSHPCSLFRRKITFTSQEERRAAASKINKEAAQCKSFFKDVAGEMADFDSPFDTVATLAEVELPSVYIY